MKLLCTTPFKISMVMGLLAIILSLCAPAAAELSQKDDGSFTLMKSEALGGLRIDMPAAEVIKLIGTAPKQSKATKWGADGLYHQAWDYPARGISLNMCSESLTGKKTVFTVTIKPPCSFKTTKGISIGSTYDEVMKAYSASIDKESTNKSTIVAGSIYGGIVFQFKGGKVSEIFIGAGAE